MNIARIAALAVCTMATAAMAQTVPPASAMSLTDVIRAVEAQGYTVLEIDHDARWFDIDALTQGGARVDLIYDAMTGNILHDDDAD